MSKSNSQKFILGLDIGYSNLKLTYGFSDEAPQTAVMPVGAAPMNQIAHSVVQKVDDSVMQVMVDGEAWGAAIDPNRLSNWVRELNDGYIASKQYKALFLAALAKCEQQVVDLIVTGLPVQQYLLEGEADKLKKSLLGSHKLSNRISVEVKDVIVVPQPTGAFMDVESSPEGIAVSETIDKGNTLVIDPGFFSFDWVTLESGKLKFADCGTNLSAMSTVLEKTSQEISADYSAAVPVNKLERAIVSGDKEIMVFGEKVELQPYLEKAASHVSELAMKMMINSLRAANFTPDVIILAGGGAYSYKSKVVEIYPRSKVVMLPKPELANARGFWSLGANL